MALLYAHFQWVLYACLHVQTLKIHMPILQPDLHTFSLNN